jgi:hypothetical protein
MLGKAEILDALVAKLSPMDEVRLATLGGSDATGRADEMSDVDLFLVVRPGAIEAAAGAVDGALRGLSPGGVRQMMRLPMPTWHGFHQAFYQLADAPEHLMVDWVIVEAGRAHPWFERERHGVHRVLFDKDGLYRPASADMDALRASAAKKVAEVRVKFAMFRHLPGKLSERGLPADAAYFYHALVLRCVVDLARCVHCPERFDFGFRYIRSDLPRDVYEQIARLCYPGDAEAIVGMTEEASGLVERLLAEWDER